MMNRGRGTPNDGRGRYFTPRGRGRGRGRSSPQYHDHAGADGSSSNVSSGNKNRGSHLVWRPCGLVPVGSKPKQVDCVNTPNCLYEKDGHFLGTKDIYSEVGNLKLVENSPEAVTPSSEQLDCMNVSVSSSDSALKMGSPSLSASSDLRVKDRSKSKEFDCMDIPYCPYEKDGHFPGTEDISSDVGKLKLGDNSPEAVTPSPEQVDCMYVSVISSAPAFKKGCPSLSASPDLWVKDHNTQRTQGGKALDAEVESGNSFHVDRLPAVGNAEMLNESPLVHKRAENSGRSENSDSLDVGVPFDICPVRTGNVVMLKAPLYVQNKIKRNEAKRSVEGQKINILRSGMLLLKNYISLNDQIKIVKKCRDLGLGSGGFYEPGYREGGKLHLRMMCLGKNWDPETSTYGDHRPTDGAKPPSIPEEFHHLVKGAINVSHSHLREQRKGPNAEHILPSMSPNICIVNFYTKTGRLGLHQDKDESAESLRRGLPVVSFSIGDSAEFLYNDQRDIEKAEKVILESGDVLIFGGQSRHVFHGVTAISPETAPSGLLDETHLLPGRLNLTFREY